jgi:translation initiation factor 3 subunit F
LLATTAASGTSTSKPTTDLEQLARSLSQVQDMLTRVLAWVRKVKAGEVPGDAALGRYLLDALGAGPESEEGAGFHNSLQVRLRLCIRINIADDAAGHLDGLIFG